MFAAKVNPEGQPQRVSPELIPHLANFPVFAGRKTWDDVLVQLYRVDYRFLGGRISFEPSVDGAHRGKLEFQYAVYDRDNQAMLGQWTRFDNTYSKKEFEDITKGIYTLRQEIPIPTGATWLRLVVRDVIGDHIGSIEIPLPQPEQPHAKTESPPVNHSPKQ